MDLNFAAKRQMMAVGETPLGGKMLFLRAISTGLVAIALLATAQAKDIKGAKDHPLIKRYEGSEIYAYQVRDFEEYGLFIKAAAKYGGKEKNATALKPLEGKLINISYRGNKGRSSLEVYRNYEAELKAAGFEALFQCKNESCGGRNFNHAVVPYGGGFSENYKDQRFYAGYLKRPEGDVYISLYVVRNYAEGGQRKNMIFSRLDVIELKAMETRMVTVSAEEMNKGLGADGHIAIYGILFDTDKSDIKPASDPVLAEINKLLTANPKLKLWVVGHTDNVGELDYNRKLSKARAKSVVQALRQRYKIDKNRLKSDGLGFLAPVASNKSEAGRALNRRVELIEQ